MPRRSAQVSLSQTIPSCLAEAEALCMKIRGLLEGAGLKKCCFAVELLARESLVNAVLHGNRSAADRSVSFDLRVGRKWIWLQVSDEGEGFAWRKAGQKRLDATTSSGRGLRLYDLYANRVRFNRKGNQIALWIGKTKGMRKEACEMAAYVIERNGKQGTVKLEGDLTAVTVPDLQVDLREVLKTGASDLVFDLSNSAMVDSSGMGLLIAAANSLASQGGQVRVTNVAPDIFRLLQGMRLTARLNVSRRA